MRPSLDSIAPPPTATTQPNRLHLSDCDFHGPGPGFVTQNYNYNSIYVGNTFSGIDNLTWTHGRQTFKAGAEIRRIQLNQDYGEHGTSYVFHGGESGSESGEKQV
jgi:hypothetical protein